MSVAAASTRYESPVGALDLLRYPRRRKEPLQAWCSADSLLLEAALGCGIPPAGTLVANDDHGTLTTALQPAALWTDSALAAIAAEANLVRNHRTAIPVLWSTQSPGHGLQLVVMRIPKHLAFFEYQLAILTTAMAPGGTLLCSGMDKHLSPQTAGLIEKYFGPVTRHPGRHKARLFSARRQTGASVPPPPPSSYYCEPLGAVLKAGANVFSGDSLDIGSRVLIRQLGRIEPAESVADLACGNGVLGFCAIKVGLGSRLLLCDESAMAVASARENAATLDVLGQVQFHHGDGFLGLDQVFDRIFCNPPFHLGHAVDDFAGRRLLAQCADHLAPGGELYIVANRHLDYRRPLKQHFRHVEVFAGDRKFTVWSARRS